MGPGLTRNSFWENRPKIALTSRPLLIFWSSIGPTMCIMSVYTLLKLVGYYDLSVLSMSVMCFQKKVWMGGGWVG